MKIEFTIKKDVPIPSASKGGKGWGLTQVLRELEVGQSIHLDGDEKAAISVRSISCRVQDKMRAKKKNFRLTIRRDSKKGTIGIWRIA